MVQSWCSDGAVNSWPDIVLIGAAAPRINGQTCVHVIWTVAHVGAYAARSCAMHVLCYAVDSVQWGCGQVAVWDRQPDSVGMWHMSCSTLYTCVDRSCGIYVGRLDID